MSAEKGHYLGQEGVWLKNKESHLFVQKFGGMTPEFSCFIPTNNKEYRVNTHWNPHFRTPFSGKMDPNSKEQGEYWGIELMRQAGGAFPCAPTFGPGNDQLLPHGDLANSDWQLKETATVSANQHTANYALWDLQGSYENLQYQKWDALYEDQNSHYMVLEISNTQNYAIPVNLAWHTTLGAPFLERGCHIINNCDHFTSPPVGTEFDETARVKPNSSFDDLSKAPDGNPPISSQGQSQCENEQVDLSTMPGYNGHAEFISGTTPHSKYLWSVCVNPFMDLAYLSIIPFGVLENQANATFMNYWIHSGGRGFAPWVDYDGGGDRNYALGMEASIGASCLGLDWSKENPSYMGKPSHLVLGSNESVTFPCINSLFTLATKGTQPEQIKQKIMDEVERHIQTLDLNFTTYQSLTTK